MRPFPYSGGGGWDQDRRQVLRVGDVELEVDAHRLRVHGEAVHITHKEFLILRHLLANAGRVCDRRELLDAAWGADYSEPATHKSVEVFIRRIRRRLEAGGSSGERIRTVRGLGYVFDQVPDQVPDQMPDQVPRQRSERGTDGASDPGPER